MTESSNKDSDTTSGKEPSKKASNKKGQRVARIVFNILLLIVPIAIYYVAVVERQTDYKRERSFRALNEIARQLDQKLESIQALFDVAPAELGDERAAVLKIPDLEESEAKNVIRKWEPYFAYLKQARQEKDKKQEYFNTTSVVRALKAEDPDGKIANCINDSDNLDKDCLIGLNKAYCPKISADLAAKSDSFCDDELVKYPEEFDPKDFSVFAEEQPSEEECKEATSSSEIYEACEKYKKHKEYTNFLGGLYGLYLHREEHALANAKCNIECWSALIGWANAVDQYKSQLAIPGLEVKPFTWNNITFNNGDKSSDAFGDNPKAKMFCAPDVEVAHIKLDRRYRASRFDVFPCDRLSVPSATEQAEKEELLHFEIPSQALFRDFQGIRDFDVLLLAKADGSIVTQWSNTGSVVSGSTYESGDAIVEFANAKSLLNIAYLESLYEQIESEESDKAVDIGQLSKADLGRLGQSHLGVRTIADTAYGVYVHPYQPPYPMYEQVNRKSVATAPFERIQTLYFIGLKNESALNAASGSIGSAARWIGLVILLLVLAGLPLLRLEFLETHESFGSLRSRSIGLSTVAFAAIVTVASMSMISHFSLNQWADHGAAAYASALKKQIHKEIGDSLGFLAKYRQLTQQAEQDTKKLEYKPGDGNEQSFDVFECPRPGQSNCQFRNVNCYLKAKSEASEESEAKKESKAWLPLRSFISTDRDGFLDKTTTSVFDCSTPYKNKVLLSDRSYFQMLRDQDGWQWDDDGKTVFVVQRLVNRIDGDKLTQIAIPRQSDRTLKFDGIISADAPVYSLRAAIPPLFYKFAVIDEKSGTTIFHSDDRRSLIENFYSETENNRNLLAAVKAQKEGPFAGRYRGASHRFHYIPVKNMPWGVVVFYPADIVESTTLYASLTAIGVYGAALLLVSLALWAYLSVRGLRLNWIWPQRRLSRTYRWVAAGLGIVAVLEGLFLAYIPDDWLLAALIVIPAVVIGGASIVSRRQQPDGNSNGTGETPLSERGASYAYGACFVLLLVTLVVIPATVLSVKATNRQVQAVLRAGLLDMAHAMESREERIEEDMARLVREKKNRNDDYPPANQIAKLVGIPDFAYSPEISTDYSFGQKGSCKNYDAGQNDEVSVVNDFWGVLSAFVSSQAYLHRLDTDSQGWHWIEGENNLGISYCSQENKNHTVKVIFSQSREAAVLRPPGRGYLGRSLLTGVVFSFAMVGLIVFVMRRYIGAQLLLAGVNRPEWTGTSFAHCDQRILLVRVSERAEDEKAGHIDAILRDEPVRNVAAFDATEDRQQWSLDQLESSVLKPDTRIKVLKNLESLLESDDNEIVIACDHSPRRRLCNPELFPESDERDTLPDAGERQRWIEVFSKLEQRYTEKDDSPAGGNRIENPSRLQRQLLQHLNRETAPMWPCLRSIRDVLYEQIRTGVISGQKQIDDYVLEHGKAHYQRMWAFSTKIDRLALYQLAKKRHLNPVPEYTAAVEALVRRDIVELSPSPHLNSVALQRFVSRAEAQSVFDVWIEEDSVGTWQAIRLPLVIILILLVAWIAYTAGDTFKALGAVLAGTLLFVNNLLRAFSLVQPIGRKPGG